MASSTLYYNHTAAIQWPGRKKPSISSLLLWIHGIRAARKGRKFSGRSVRFINRSKSGRQRRRLNGDECIKEALHWWRTGPARQRMFKRDVGVIKKKQPPNCDRPKQSPPFLCYLEILLQRHNFYYYLNFHGCISDRAWSVGGIKNKTGK